MIELNYVSCNWDSIYMACGLLISMTITLFILKVSAFSEIYTTEGVAVPFFFYVGDKRAVRATVERMMRETKGGILGKARGAKENFENPNPTSANSRTTYATAGELFTQYIGQYIGDPIRAISTYKTRASSINDDMIQSYSDAQIRATQRVRDLSEKIVADFAPT